MNERIGVEQFERAGRIHCVLHFSATRLAGGDAKGREINAFNACACVAAATFRSNVK